ILRTGIDSLCVSRIHQAVDKRAKRRALAILKHDDSCARARFEPQRSVIPGSLRFDAWNEIVVADSVTRPRFPAISNANALAWVWNRDRIHDPQTPIILFQTFARKNRVRPAQH